MMDFLLRIALDDCGGVLLGVLFLVLPWEISNADTPLFLMAVSSMVTNIIQVHDGHDGHLYYGDYCIGDGYCSAVFD
jgi:hypothetical protein